MFNFISTAFAVETAATADAGMMAGADMTQTMIMMAVFAVLIYFILIRPQNKRMKAHRDLVAALEVGDEVAINGGILGKVSKVATDFISITVADGVDIKCQRQAVTTVLPKGTLKTV